MKLKRILILIISIITIGSSGSSLASVTLDPFFSFFRYNFAQYSPGNPPQPIPGSGLCIGGAKCGLDGYLRIVYPPSSYVSQVFITAHDNVGNKHNAALGMFVDGLLVETQDVKKAGSVHTFYLNTFVSTLEFRSFHKNGASNGDETVIMDIYSL